MMNDSTPFTEQAIELSDGVRHEIDVTPLIQVMREALSQDVSFGRITKLLLALDDLSQRGVDLANYQRLRLAWYDDQEGAQFSKEVLVGTPTDEHWQGMKKSDLGWQLYLVMAGECLYPQPAFEQEAISAG